MMSGRLACTKAMRPTEFRVRTDSHSARDRTRNCGLPTRSVMLAPSRRGGVSAASGYAVEPSHRSGQWRPARGTMPHHTAARAILVPPRAPCSRGQNVRCDTAPAFVSSSRRRLRPEPFASNTSTSRTSPSTANSVSVCAGPRTRPTGAFASRSPPSARPGTASGWARRLLPEAAPKAGRGRGRGRGDDHGRREPTSRVYADEHTKAPKHRSWSLASPTVEVLPAGQVAPPVVARRAAPVDAVPALRCSRGASVSATRCSGSA